MPLSLAGISPEDQELTVGALLAGFCVLAALIASLTVWSSWRSRWTRGESIIPVAARPLLQIPPSLLIFGLIIGVFMSVLALSVSMGSIESALQPPPTAVDEIAVDIEVADDELPESAASSASEELTSAEPASDDLRRALLQTVVWDIAMILMLGIPVLLVQLRQQSVRHSVAIPQNVEEPAGAASAAEVVDDQHQATLPATAAISGTAAEDQSATGLDFPVETWRLGRELRFAAETCLAAWLPTAIIKLTMITVLQEDSQHPFLEMMQEGEVGVEILILIGITAVLLAPVMEELLYRVIILGGLLSRPRTTSLTTSFAIGVTSLLFAFAHGFPDSVALLPLAVAIAWVYHQRRSYRTVVLVHLLFNGFNILIAGLNLL